MIYEFRCQSCGKKIEKYMKLSEHTAFLKCDKCGKDAKQIISLSTPILFTPFYDFQSDITYTGFGQKAKALRRAGLEETEVLTRDIREERKWKRKEKREKRQKRQQERGEVELPAQARRRAEGYLNGREKGGAKDV